LPLPLRKRIWVAMGPEMMAENHAVRSEGLVRRIQLAIACVQRVLPIWYSAFPKDNKPELMLEMVERYLNDQTDWDSVWELKNNFWGRLDNLLCKEKHFDSLYVGFASACVVTTVLQDEVMDDLADSPLDEELDAYSWDSRFYASLAYAGGASWDKHSSIPRRREFWTWYISEIPEVYNNLSNPNFK